MEPSQSSIRALDLKKTTASNSIEFRYLGRCDYNSATNYQKQIFEYLLANNASAGMVLGLEHDPVITLGIRARDEDIVSSRSTIQNHDVEIVATDRGGSATYHNPGQLIVYPILNLRALGLGAKDYIALLERTTVTTLQSYGIACDTHDGAPGVYTPIGKIASLGVRISRGVSQHGVAINVTNDLAGFSWIRVCGSSFQPVDRLIDALARHQNLGAHQSPLLSEERPLSVEQVFERWRQCWFDLLT